jgi:long-chain fatty acid transport protein
VRNHFTLGFGYKLSNTAEINAALTLAPSVSVTGGGITISHAQNNMQFMFTQRF